MVVGTATHPGHTLPGLPSAVRSARAVADALSTVCGMGDRVTLLTDPKSPSDVLEALAAAIERAEPTEERYESGTVLFYFVGHGLRGPGRQLYLATATTTSQTDTAHSVPYTEIERYLSDAAADPVVILDCCFAGNAQEPTRPPATDPFGGARPDGSYLLASAMRNALSYAPRDAEHTLFSGHLLSLLREGDAGGPKWLTLSGLYRLLDQRLQGTEARPYGGGTARMGELTLTVNRRYTPVAADGPAEAGAADPDAVCPYPGILPFLPEQHHLFFGRDELTRDLLRRVEQARPGEPVVLVGPSGVGKSSLLRAGLSVAAGRAGLGPVRIVPAPGDRPFRALAEAWAAAVDRAPSEVVRDLEQGRFSRPTPADGPAGLRGHGRTAPRVLVVDQLEEYFTLCEDTAERERFAEALTAGAGNPDSPRIVLALRADYYGDALSDPRLAPLVRTGHFAVPALSDAEVEAAVVGPAEYGGLEWEEGVPQLLRREVNEERRSAGDASALPFLAYALREIWLRRHGTTLTYAGYRDSGGIRDAVARAADAIHADLDEAGRADLRHLLLAMVRVADGEGRLLRRRVPPEELEGSEDLLRRLADARLVVVDEEGGAQLGHDSLLYAWARLSGWIDEVRDDLLRLRRLTAAAEGWDEAGRKPSGLYEGDALEEARKLTAGDVRAAGEVRTAQVPVRQVVRDFVAASDRTQRRRRFVTRAWIAGLSALAVVAASLFGWASYENGQAADRERDLIARELANQADVMRERDPQTALRLSLAAYRTAETPETRSSLYAAATTVAPIHLVPAKQHRKPVLNLAYSRDGKVLAASHRGGRVQFWDVSDPAVPVEAGRIKPGSGAAAIAFHPSSRLLAAQSPKELTLWDTSDPNKPKRLSSLPIPELVTFTLAFSADGRTVAAGSEKGRLRLWDVSDPARPTLRTERTVADADLISVAFTRDGRHLITGNGNGNGEKGSGQPAQVRLWDVSDPERPVLRDTERTDTVMAVAAHPRRDLVVATGASGKIAWWEVEEGRELRRVKVEEYRDRWGVGSGGMPSLAFSGDGRFLAGADREHGVRRAEATMNASELKDGMPGSDGLPTGEPTQSVAYGPDGRYLASGDFGGEVWLWPERAWAPTVEGSPSGIHEAGTSPFSSDGTLVITQQGNADYTSTTRVWDINGLRKPRIRYTLPKGWEANYFLTSHKKPVILAHYWTEGLKHTFQLWEFGPAGGPKKSAGITLTADSPHAVVSSDGGLLAVGSREETGIALWDIRDPLHPVRRGTVPARASGDFLSTGSLWFAGAHSVATIEDGQHIRFWDVSDPDRPRKGGLIKDAASFLQRAMYDDSSRLLITEDVGDNIRLWDFSKPARPVEGDRIPAGSGSYLTTRDGELATALNDGTVEFWDVTDPDRARKKPGGLRLDREVETFDMTADGRYAVTTEPYRIWSVGKNGRWRTPALLTLENAEAVRVPPSDSPDGGRWLAVTVKDENSVYTGTREQTHLLDLDADRLYKNLCASYPLSIPEDQWDRLFPHLDHRRSCD
ncbi:AAA family ATPase [Streptomyces phyllanthi]|uniref:caspase, EACC1-associated type n=1 Tax=Streptomyces phyllanthi TaxID=1803180 RepID=UPI001884575D|nr:AAA family ATPase [Streptomyces phyllanthi]